MFGHTTKGSPMRFEIALRYIFCLEKSEQRDYDNYNI